MSLPPSPSSPPPPASFSPAPSSFELRFETLVQNAVRQSVQEQRPLFVFIKHQSDPSLNETFTAKFVTPNVEEKIVTNFVLLKLTPGTVEFGYFEQLFKNLSAPSFYIVNQGKVEIIVTESTSVHAFEQKIIELSKQSQQAVGSNASGPSNNSALPTSEISGTDVNSNINVEGSSESANSNTPQLQPQSYPHENQSQEHNTLSDHDRSVLRHKQEVAEQRRQQKLERQRLRDLLEADRRERQSQMRAEQMNSPSSILKSTTATPKHDTTHCTLAIKLFDGSTIKHDFESQQTLTDVRTYLDVEVKVIPSTSNMPAFATTFQPTGYSFHRPTLPRVTYTEEQESNTLASLDLAPRSILILKPNYTDLSKANDTAPDGEKVGLLKSMYRGIGRFGAALSSFFDYGVDDVHNHLAAAAAAAGSATGTGEREEGVGAGAGAGASTSTSVGAEIHHLHQHSQEHHQLQPRGHPIDTPLDLPFPVAPGLISVGDRALSSSLISIETDERSEMSDRIERMDRTERNERNDRSSIHADSRPPESRSSTPRSISLSRIQTLHDSNDTHAPRPDFYNGNSINLNERDEE